MALLALLAATAAEITAVMETVTDMEERMSTLVAAAANFDIFLSRKFFFRPIFAEYYRDRFVLTGKSQSR